jgi:hypothetical protein
MSTTFPASIDTNISLPIQTDSFSPVSGITVNNLQGAILAIEGALGIHPSSTYGNVANRFSILEGLVGNLQVISLAGDLGGTLSSPLVIGLQGLPVSSAPPAVGDILFWNGIAWVPSNVLINSVFVAGGDLAGDGYDQTVIGLQNHPITATTPTIGQFLEFNGTSWAPTTISPAFTAGGDLSGSSTDQTVIGLKGIAVPTPSGDGTSLTYNAGSYSWSVAGNPLLVPVGRGLCYSLQASAGTTVVSGQVPYWRDQCITNLGRAFYDYTTDGGAVLGNSINGFPTLDFTVATQVKYRDPYIPSQYVNLCYSSTALSIATVVKYTGAVNMATGAMATVPLIVGEDSANNPPHTAGLSVGLDPSNSSLIQFAGWIYDFGASTLKFALSANVSGSVAHYVVMTFGAGTISLYVDGLAVVQTTGVGRATDIDTATIPLVIGSNQVSSESNFNGSILELDGWNVCLTAGEIVQVQNWLQTVSGL